MSEVESPSLAAALAAAQDEMPAVEKDGKNPHYGSSFVTLDSLIDKTRPVLNRHGLAILQWCSGTLDEPTLTTQLVHKSGEKMGATMPLYLGRRDMQSLGAAITYARRYAWAALLGISSDEDDDGETAGRETRETALGRTVDAETGELVDKPWPGVWPMGRHKGESLKDTPGQYLHWYVDKGQNALWREACADELALRKVVT